MLHFRCWFSSVPNFGTVPFGSMDFTFQSPVLYHLVSWTIYFPNFGTVPFGTMDDLLLKLRNSIFWYNRPFTFQTSVKHHLVPWTIYFPNFLFSISSIASLSSSSHTYSYTWVSHWIRVVGTTKYILYSGPIPITLISSMLNYAKNSNVSLLYHMN